MIGLTLHRTLEEHIAGSGLTLAAGVPTMDCRRNRV
jgi:hypothetical protein